MKVTFRNDSDHWSRDDICELQARCAPRVGETVVLPPDTEYGSAEVADVVWYYDGATVEATVYLRNKNA